MHTAVLLHEAIEALAIKPDGIYVDGTFGRGGHSRLILSRLGQDGRLISFDKDLDAIRVANEIEDERFEVKHGGFSQMQSLLQEAGVEQVDGILLDLGLPGMNGVELCRFLRSKSDVPILFLSAKT